MTNDNTPQFPLPGWWPDDSKQVVHEFDGRRYYLRHLLQRPQYVLYRVADPLVVESTLFVPSGIRFATPERPLTKDEAIARELPYPKTLFAEQVRSGQNGRLALYNHLPARNCLAGLFFAQDGTGKFHDWNPFIGDNGSKTRKPLDFVWDGSRYGISSGKDILTCEWETLLPLCEDVFVNQIWPRMKNPYQIADHPDVRFRFVRGCREELGRITRCICHTDPTLFADPADTRRVRITYEACTSKHPGGFTTLFGAEFRIRESETARKLCALAFLHNTFEGETWKYFDSQKSAISMTPAEVRVVAAPPSMHERAEALLALSDWLDGKVTAEEKSLLLNISR